MHKMTEIVLTYFHTRLSRFNILMKAHERFFRELSLKQFYVFKCVNRRFPVKCLLLFSECLELNESKCIVHPRWPTV